MTRRPHPPAGSSQCTQRRLAETPLGAIDSCACGMMQLHVGALTLRLTPEAVAELSALLEESLVAHSKAETSSSLATSEVLRPAGAIRGQA